MKKGFLLTVALITAILSISLLPPPITSDARGVTSVTISTIRNSCIVNNANIAVQNINTTPLDAINNWWGMPTGATHDNIPSGDAVGQNVLHAPHLSTMPFLCDLTDADWIPFSEQDLQHAINSHIPYLGGIAFALIDLEWGSGAKFDIVTHPNYGSHHLEAKITIQPNPTGELITIALDMNTVPTDENLQKIVTCELMPLFVNSLQQVQNRYVSPSQHIASMVVMERDLMMRFTPPTEITPEPTPEFVLNYDASCLPNVNETTENIIESGDGESLNLVTIPPLEGEFELLTTTPIESNLSTLSEPTIETVSENPCPDDAGWCDLLEQGDVFTYVNFNQLISINRIDDTIIEFKHILPAYITNPYNPSWGVVDAETHHYRLAFNCTALDYPNRLCYWDSVDNSYYYNIDNVGPGVISPNGQKIAHWVGGIPHRIWIWDLANNSYTAQQNLRDENGNSLLPFGSVRWGDANTIYYGALPFGSSSTNELEIWRYDFGTASNTRMVEPDTTNYRVPMPLYFDARSNDLLYWMSGYSEYSLNYLGNWSYTSPDLTYYGVYWSPRAGENRAIRVKTNPNNSSEYCIDSFQTVSLPTNFNRITCRPMQFGFVDWATDVNLEATIQVPPTEACLARIVNPYDKSDNPGFNYYSIRKFPAENTLEMISPRPAHYSSVIVNGRDLYAGGGVSWWYVEYNHNGTPIIGWIRGDGVEIDPSIVDGCNINDVERVPIIDFDNDANDDGIFDDPIINVLTIEPIYDYPLGVPLPPWYSDMPNFEELKNNWGNFSIDEQLSKWHSEGEAWSDDCTGAGEEPIRRNCTLIVYVVFHDLFRKIYQRDLMLSDIFAVTYNLELGPALDFRRSDVAQQALGANYFGIIRQYCHDTQGIPFEEIIIGVNENANCKPNDIPIEELVHSYTYIDQETSVSVTKTGYLATLQAWYDDAVYIANWYYGTTDLSLIQTVDSISTGVDYDGAVRLRLLLPPPVDQANTFVSKLQLQAEEKRPRYSDTIRPWEYVVWGNHAYSTALDSPYNTVINIWRGQGANPNTVYDPDGNLIKFCVLNLYHPAQHNIPNGGEDVFIIHTTSPTKRNYGQTTTFEVGMRPNWTFGAPLPEIDNAPYTSIFDNTRLCPCLTSSNERYPDNPENARRCYD